MAYNTITEQKDLWKKILAKIEKRINDKHIFDSFFGESSIYKIENDKMYIALNSALACKITGTKYIVEVQEAVLDVTQSQYNITFITNDEIEKLSNNEPVVTEKKRKFFANSFINTKYTLDNFVVGSCNREASQAALMIAANPGKSFNPLFIFSQSGLGKTHLLHAIGNYIRENNPMMTVLYISTDEFVDEFVRSVRGEEEIESFKDYFRSVDVLLIDDIQFLAKKSKTSEMFFTVFNTMINNGKQVVLTSDCHPNNLKGLEQRLVTRFNQGLSIEIKNPDKDTLLSILKQKVETNDLSLKNFDDGVLEFFATHFDKNVRDLEGAINRLLFYTINIKQTDKITMQVAMDSVSSIINVKETETILNEEKIIDVVADYYHLTASQLKGNSRTSQLALARHISMYLIRDVLDVPFKKIGSIFGGKDHSTVMSAVEKIEKRLKTDNSLSTAVNELKKQLNVTKNN